LGDSFRVAELAQWISKATSLVESGKKRSRRDCAINIGRLLYHLTDTKIGKRDSGFGRKSEKRGRVKAEKDFAWFYISGCQGKR